MQDCCFEHFLFTVGITEAALIRVHSEKFKPTGTWHVDSVHNLDKSIRTIQKGLLNHAL